MAARRVAITGTPGTGKTTLAQALANRDHLVIDLGIFAREHGLLGERDAKRDTRVVDERKLARAFAKTYPEGPLFVEGHLSHFLPVERVLVLRAKPSTIRRRLTRRGYSMKKTDENALAEALDVVAGEALAEHGARRVFEVDTTGARSMALAEIAETLLTSRPSRSLLPAGTVAWDLDRAGL